MTIFTLCLKAAMSWTKLPVFVYGTLKRNQPNYEVLAGASEGKWEFVGVAKTVQLYPLVIASPYNVPFLLDCPGTGKVFNMLP